MQDVDPGWTVFYRNTLAALATAGAHGGTNAGMAPVHDRAAALAVGPHVVELGCCFGFLSLRLAADGHRVTAVDLVARHRAVAGRASRRSWAHPSRRWRGTRSPCRCQDASADTVFAVHLLEHLPAEPRRGRAHRDAAGRPARVVVAVPFEDEPAPAWGHVRTFDLDDLHALGAATGLPYAVDEHHGGWLTVEKRT